MYTKNKDEKRTVMTLRANKFERERLSKFSSNSSEAFRIILDLAELYMEGVKK